MIKNANLYKEEIQKLFFDAWYDPRYQYYFGGDARYPLDFNNSHCRQFVSLNCYNEIIGFLSYFIDTDVRLAHRFGIIRFTDSYEMTFSHDIYRVIDDCFNKFGIRTIEFAVIRGNPIERSYDKIITHVGGRILCTRSNRALDLQGNLCDDKLYEVTRKNYLNFKDRNNKEENENVFSEQ